ncbi:MAG: polysaccharide deacetylase family protein [Candidatus Hodarchaeales archaeon]|jgi:peptidoglycan/xylan/chitin deacetylase (PgdA/CDA1 family)
MNEEMTVCLTFDFDAESAQVRQLEEPGRVSKGRFAVRRGMPRILSLLKKHEIKATFFVCGWVAENYHEITEEIVSSGHEIAAHGYLHEFFDTLSLHEEKTIIEKMTRPLENFIDVVKGFRAPYFRLSQNTLRLIADAGYIYDSSLLDDDRPYILQIQNLGKKLIEFPVEWYNDDWIIFEDKQQSPTAVLDIWKSQFDALSDIVDVPHDRRIFQLTCHPAAIGHAYRIKVLDRLISHMKSNQATFSRMMDVAESILNE